ncbi:unnamed protein product [Oikopleura dioica]|uniref:ATP synthase peripheral stalk subunit F6, mitochondrial n=1 Tax=Oikopleura dioica TaxID=34765 RepID=E4WS54_OIKDI|nr:unnamed protein product [Oikopleura dioica]
MLRVAARALSVSTTRRSVDPVQAIFLNKIREYKTRSETEGIVDGGAAFAQESADIQERLARTYGGGNMDAFPEINFTAPDLHQDSIDGERTIDIVVA